MQSDGKILMGGRAFGKSSVLDEIMEQKQREADKAFRVEYGYLPKNRVNTPAKNATEKRKRQRKAAKASKRKNR